MQIDLRFFANFRETVGEKTISREYDDGTTVGEVLDALVAEFDLAVLDGDGAIRPQVNVMRNGRDVVHIEGERTTLSDGDKLSIFPPVAGG